jgi:hypothetical protein
MDLPLDPGDKYALIAFDGATEIEGVLDLGEGFFAIRGSGLRLPDHWREWIGSIEADAIERSALVLLAKKPSNRPGVLDDENLQLQQRVNWLYWSLLACGRFWMEGEGAQLSGAHVDGEISTRQTGRMPLIFLPRGLRPSRIEETDLRRAADLARNLGAFMKKQGMFRAKRAIQTFWAAFAETNLGERIHQFVRVVSDGFAKVSGGAQFRERCTLLIGKKEPVVRRQLWLMRNNAEHFNKPDLKLGRLTVRRGLERAHLRAHQAESLARHCVSRFIENRDLWKHFRHDGRIDAFWNRTANDLATFWGTPLDLRAAVAGFDPTCIVDEGT